MPSTLAADSLRSASDRMLYRREMTQRVDSDFALMASLLKASGKHNVESAPQELSLMFETDGHRWFATGPWVFGDKWIVLEIYLRG